MHTKLPRSSTCALALWALVSCGGPAERGASGPGAAEAPAAPPTEGAELDPEALRELRADAVARWATDHTHAEADLPLLQRAEAELRRRLEEQPKSVEALIALASLLRHRAMLTGTSTPDPDLPRLLEAAVEADPDHQEALQLLAEYHTDLGDAERALVLTQRLARLDPGNPAWLLDEGTILMSLDRLDEAERVLLQAIEILKRGEDYERLSRARAALGDALKTRGRAQEAEQALLVGIEEIELRRARNPELGAGSCPYQSLGHLYAATGRAREATDVFVRGGELNPTDDLLQQRAAEYLLREGDPVRSATFLKRAQRRKQSPVLDRLSAAQAQAEADWLRGAESQGDIAALVDAAATAFGYHELDRAQAYLSRARALGPSPEGSVVSGFLALLQGRHAEAFAQFEQAAGDPTTSVGASIGGAHLAIARQEERAALEALDEAVPQAEALAASEGPSQAYHHLVWELGLLGRGWAYNNLGQPERSLEAFDQLLRVAPTHHLGLLGKGNALAALGRDQQAEHLFERALLFQPEDPEAHAGLGLIQATRGHHSEAEFHFQRALEVAPRPFTCPHEGLGLLYLAQGRHELAKQHFERAIELDPDVEHRKYTGLARIYIEEGRTEEARSLLEDALRNRPGDPEATELLRGMGDR